MKNRSKQILENTSIFWQNSKANFKAKKENLVVVPNFQLVDAKLFHELIDWHRRQGLESAIIRQFPMFEILKFEHFAAPLSILHEFEECRCVLQVLHLFNF